MNLGSNTAKMNCIDLDVPYLHGVFNPRNVDAPGLAFFEYKVKSDTVCIRDLDKLNLIR